MKQKKFRRLLSVALVLVMLLSALPVVSLAVEMGTKPADGTTTGNPFPQGTGGSNSFRIPAMVTLDDGTLVAAADARWNTTYDGGGLDTAVAYSTDDGATWTNYLANYLGDNGDTYNGSGSTAFIDPALATDGKTVYMLCDLYPYGIALNGSGNTAPSTDVGFNRDGKLLLSNNNHSSYDYYLDNGKIYSSAGDEVQGYTVNAYFNITGNDTDSNLFFSDSPYQVVRTGYLYLTKSNDGGKSWSEPTLIPNVKTDFEQVCLVGPGRGLVTGGKIIFPVYSYNGTSSSQQMGFIYSSDGGETWTRSANFTGDSWSSESAVVALKDGTLRFFYRNGTSRLCYVDYSWTSGWGSAENTGIATNSNTQISAISYSKTVDGKQVILVSCPTGSNNAGSADSSASARLNGRIQIGLVNSDYTMTWKTPIDVTTNDSQFMYSCLSALTDSEGNETGEVAILYENQESKWGTGDNCYYTMAFKTYDLSKYVTFDEIVDENIHNDSTGVIINFGTADYSAEDITITKKTDVAALAGKTYVAYDISIEGFSSGTATVTIPLNDAFEDNANLYAVYINGSGEIDGNRIEGEYNTEANTFTFTAEHFSTYAVLANETSKTKDITLTVGESKTESDETGNYESSYTGDGLNESIATVTVKGTTTGGTPAEEESIDKVTSLSAGTYIIGNGTQWLVLNGSTLGYTTDASQATQWTVAKSRSNWTIKSGSYYLYHPDNSAGLSVNTSSRTWSYDGSTGFYYTYYILFWSTTEYLRWNGSAWEASETNSNNGAAYTYRPGKDAVPGTDSTKITITGVSAGKTSVVVGDTLYKITVNRKERTVNLSVGGTATYSDASTSAPVVADSSIASATLSGGQLTIKGLKDGTTTVTTDTTVYTVTVSEGTAISIKENETKTISVTLEDGQTVTWSSADSSYVGVAGKYDTNAGAYTNEAILAGQNVTNSPVTVTATIKDADGNVVRTQKWLVTVTKGDADANISSKGIYFNIGTIENCTVYYSINGGELIPVNGTGVTTGNWTGNGTYKGHFNIMFFAAPNEGYALTYMSISGSADQYYTLTNGNPDGTGSDAWPFVDANASTIPSNSNDFAWKRVNGSLHGFRWALMEDNMTIDQMKVLFSNAIALGCDGATTITKNSTEGMGSASSPTVCKFVAQKLPTVEKSIKSITHDGTETTYTDGMKVELGDTINYSVVVTRYATTAAYGTITYDNEKLTDELTGNSGIRNPDMGTSTTSDKTYTYTTSLTLTMVNYADVVKDGKITNTAEFSYSYSSQYSAGSLTSDASAVAEITVRIPEYVIDFGLPVTIDLDTELGGAAILSGTASFGDVSASGTSFTYTPNKVLTGTDHVALELENDQSYGVNIIPASNVLYEDNFLTVNTEKDKDTYLKWSQSGSISGTQSADQDIRYGYDIAYASSTGNSMGSARTVSGLTSGTGSKYLTTTFYGNGFDLIGTAGPDTGYVYLLLQGPTSKLIIIDTSYVGGGTLSQVPLAHEELTEGSYTVNIRAAYRKATTAESSVSAASAGPALFGVNSSASSALDDVYAMVDELLADGLDFDDVEFVYFDGNSPLAELDNASRATYALLTDDSTGGEESTTTVTKLEGTTVTIDGFRVYRNTENDAYAAQGEHGATYTNVLDATLNSDTFTAYTETATGNWTKSNYETMGGPQNEVYLDNTSAIAFEVAGATIVQISARVAKGTTANLVVNGTRIGRLSSNTEMYYAVTPVNGIVTIKNDVANSLLALGNLKTNGTVELMAVSADDEPVVLSLLRMAPAPVEPEEPETSVFTPEKLDVSVKSINVIRNKLVTVTVTASTDVAELTINGKTLKPINALLVDRGWSSEYIYVFTDTVKRTESKTYEVVAYDADGVASEARTVTG